MWFDGTSEMLQKAFRLRVSGVQWSTELMENTISCLMLFCFGFDEILFEYLSDNYT